MLYLNNSLLTSERIIASFEANVLHARQPLTFDAPSPLKQFKNKLRSIFFTDMNKTASDEEVLKKLRNDERFTSNYLKLKQVLEIIFSLTDTDNKTMALEQLKTIDVSDWDSDIAQSQFEELNARYGYFEQGSSALLAIFNELTISVRAMCGLIEESKSLWREGKFYHIPEDKSLYLQAYQLMALNLGQSDLTDPTGIFDKIAQETFKLITQTDTQKDRPYAEFYLNLPPASEIQDKIGWFKLIKKEGQKALPFLSRAAQIEQKIADQSNEATHRAPQTLEEAKSMSMLCQYERATESADSLSFAKLCYKYNVRASRFNRSLDYMASGWPKKTHDSIPDIMIQSESAVAKLYWVKLSPGDRRALILGDILDNCQSIGGKGDSCVKDSVSLSDNGLYVLLQQRGKGHPIPKNPDGTINDTDFNIVGTSYIWKSNTGNICLDSYEGLKGSVDDLVLRKILAEFATTLLRDNPDVKRVTLGRGGKTPQDLFEKTAIADEKSRGLFFPDSKSQYCIAKTRNGGLNETQSQALLQLLQGKHNSYKAASFRECIEHLSYYINDHTHFVEQLAALLKVTPALDTELTPEALGRLLSLTLHPTLNDLAPISFDELDALTEEQRAAQLTTVSTARLIWRETTVRGLIRAFQYVPEEQHLHIVKILNWSGSGWEGSRQTILHAAAKEAKLLNTILTIYPEEQRLGAVKEKNEFDLTVLHFAAQDPESIRMILTLYPEEERLQALNEKEHHQHTVLHLAIGSVEALREILFTYPETILEKEHTGKTALHLAIERAEDHLDSLQTMLETLPEDLLLKTFNEKDDKGRTPLQLAATQRSVGALSAILAKYPKLHLQDALDAIDNEFNQNTALHLATQNVDCLTAMIAVYPRDQLLEALKKKNREGNVLHNASEYPDSLKVILAIYPESQRLDAVTLANDESLLHLVTSNTESFEIIMDVFQTNQQRLDALRKQDKRGHSVLHTIAKSARYNQEQFSAILRILTKNERFELIRENIDFFNSVEHITTIKNILLEKIKEESQYGKSSYFATTKRQIISSKTFAQLKEQIHQLDHLLAEQPRKTEGIEHAKNFKGKLFDQKKGGISEDNNPNKGSFDIS